ncbi:hypothetical protein MSG28_000034 [Choristoneura fumiferana]|uniref:Uncharacterized protein n=1 Tax=Choristoneura fumiferana TaxID=7141 RepID=A0ACC0JZD3_CHOFU|nr:hypothetical protein MSG28_000034 [Choristoneura fumiferana]
MVAQKRGRGAKAQAAKQKAAPVAEEVPEAEVAEAVEEMEENNGDSEQVEQDEVHGEMFGGSQTQTLSRTALLAMCFHFCRLEALRVHWTMVDSVAFLIRVLPNMPYCNPWSVAGDEAGAGDAPTEEAAQAEGDGAPGAEAEARPEEPKEEKVESGKLLVENLPASYLFDYQDKLKELFSKHGEVTNIKRGPIIVTELTITPTLSAIVEYKNKESLQKLKLFTGPNSTDMEIPTLFFMYSPIETDMSFYGCVDEKQGGSSMSVLSEPALTEEGTLLDGSPISVAVESRAETAVLVGVPYEAGTEYVKQLFSQCGEVAHIHEFSKTKYKILRVTFHAKESVERALKLDRELRINGFLVTVSKYRDEDEQKAHAANANKNKRQHPQQQQQNRNPNPNASPNANANPNANRQNNFRPRGGAFNARGNFRGGRGRGGFPARGGGFPARGGYAPVNSYAMPGFMVRPVFQAMRLKICNSLIYRAAPFQSLLREIFPTLAWGVKALLVMMQGVK